MYDWQTPPPRKPSKSKAISARERREKVASLIKQGLLKSERIKQALLKVAAGGFYSGAVPRLCLSGGAFCRCRGSRRPSPVRKAT